MSTDLSTFLPQKQVVNLPRKQVVSLPRNQVVTLVRNGVVTLSGISNKDGWKSEQIQNGIFSPCYNFNPLYGSIENYLNVIVGGGTDVVIKLMDLKTDVCTRYVFINSNSTFRILNIPEGQYYLKIAYGKRWFTKVDSGICIGKFTSAALYEKAEEILDFRLIQEATGYSIPSYEVSLDVVSSGIQNSLSSNEISEEEFNR